MRLCMITIQHRVGRLVETRFAAPLTDEEIATFADGRGRALRAVASDRVVCIDATRMSVLPPDQSERLLAVLRQPSPGLLRSAFLLPPSRGVVALQFERIIRESKQLAARSFVDRAQLEEWLGEVLTTDEVARLRGFLDERHDGAPNLT
jgi:hypothetical protein